MFGFSEKFSCWHDLSLQSLNWHINLLTLLSMFHSEQLDGVPSDQESPGEVVGQGCEWPIYIVL